MIFTKFIGLHQADMDDGYVNTITRRDDYIKTKFQDCLFMMGSSIKRHIRGYSWLFSGFTLIYLL